MELPIHVEPPSPSGPARWIPSVRAVALLTLGVGIGVLASIPFGANPTNAAVVAILAASVAAALVVLLPGNTMAVGVADVLLGIAVLATAFGRLGPLYIPLLLAFFVVTARVERPARYSGAHLRWDPALEHHRGRHALAAPPRRVPDDAWLPSYEPQMVGPAAAVLEPRADEAWLPPDSVERPTWLSEHGHVTDGEQSPAAAHEDGDRLGAADEIQFDAPVEAMWLGVNPPIDEDPAEAVPDDATVDAVTPPTGDPHRELRALPAARRMLTAARRARRAVSFHARAGFENLRNALVEEPQIDADLPPWPEGQGPVDDLLIEIPEPELVGAGRRASAGSAGAPASGPSTARARLRPRVGGHRPRMHRSNGGDEAI